MVLHLILSLRYIIKYIGRKQILLKVDINCIYIYFNDLITLFIYFNILFELLNMFALNNEMSLYKTYFIKFHA